MKIRKIRKDDLQILATLNAQIFKDTTKNQALKTFEEAWKKRIPDGCLVAEEDQKILGAIIVEKKVTFRKKSSGITSIFVKKEWQSKGVGKELIERSLAVLKKNGYKNVSLTVALDNDRAISLYEKYGFKAYRMLYLKEL